MQDSGEKELLGNPNSALSFSPPPLFSLVASSLSWLWPEVAPPPQPPLSLSPSLSPPVSLRPRRGAESYPRATRCTAHSSKAADPLQWGTACYGLMNSVFGAGRAVRVPSLYTVGVGSGGIGGAGGSLYLLQAVMTHKADAVWLPRGQSVSLWISTRKIQTDNVCFVLKGSRQHVRFDVHAPLSTFSSPHQGHSANTWWTAPGFSFPPWIFLSSHIICKLMCGN